VGAVVDIVLYVIGEGRWRPQNFHEVLFDDSRLVWDTLSPRSNYEELAQSLMAQNGGTSWLTEAASQPDLTAWYPGHPELSGQTIGSSAFNGSTASPGLSSTYFALCRGGTTVPGTTSTIRQPQQCPSDAGPDADAGDAGDTNDASDATEAGNDAAAAEAPESGVDAEVDANDASDASTGDVVDAALDAEDAGASDAGDATDAADGREVSSPDPCAGFDDIDVALLGAHPMDVWVTRLRARLPVYALANDLRIEASPAPVTVSNVHQVPPSAPVQSRQGCASGTRPHDAFGTGALVAITALGVGAIRRRRRR
jgi:hypothetical protein